MKQKTLYVPEEQLTYGQKYLLDLNYARQLSTFLRDQLNNKYSLMYISKIATGKLNPSIRFIFDTIKIIPPEYWFYTVSEKCPRQRKDRKYVKKIKDSKNYAMILDIFNEHKLFVWLQDKGVQYKALHQVINGRSDITPAVIFKLKDYLLPVNWFVK